MKNKITLENWKSLLEYRAAGETEYAILLEKFGIDAPEIKDLNSDAALEHVADFYVDWPNPMFGN